MAQYVQDLVQHAADDSMKPSELLQLQARSSCTVLEVLESLHLNGGDDDEGQCVLAGRWIRRLMAMLPQQISRCVSSIQSTHIQASLLPDGVKLCQLTRLYPFPAQQHTFAAAFAP